jgi:hypothetical protein
MDSPASKDLVLQIKNILKVVNPLAASPYKIQKEEDKPNSLDFQLANSEKKIALFFSHEMVNNNKMLLLLLRITSKEFEKPVQLQFMYDPAQQTWVNKAGEYLDTAEMGKLIHRKL